MKYAIRYYKSGFGLMSKANEIIIKYNEKDDQLIYFATECIEQEQRLVVNICGIQSDEDFNESISIFKETIAAHSKFSIMLNIEQPYALDLYEANIPFFYADGITTFAMLEKVLNQNVTDVYIKDDLGFYLKDIKNLCNKYNTQIRVKPNIIQHNDPIDEEDIDQVFKTFFIRPDDIDNYEGIIDVIEFAGPLETQKPLYEIYNEKRWNGDLGQLILNFNHNLDNRLIIPVVGEVRVNCHQRCKIGKCNICGAILNCSKTLDEKGIYIIKDKNNELKND